MEIIHDTITKRMRDDEIVLNAEMMYIANIYITLSRTFTRSVKGKKYTLRTETRDVVLKNEIFVQSKINDDYVREKICKKCETMFEKHSSEIIEITRVELLKEFSYVHSI